MLQNTPENKHLPGGTHAMTANKMFAAML